MNTKGRRFDAEQAERYWRERLSAAIDEDNDPQGLSLVCCAGQPALINRYRARLQRHVFQRLLRKATGASRNLRALDIGCGTARWSLLLKENGWKVTGIDIGNPLLERNRREHPDIEFEPASVTEYRNAQPFDLVTSVTVLQHLPFDAQEAAAERIRDLVRPHGNLLILENVRDQATHMFARPPSGWQDLFVKRGFELVELLPYDYGLVARAAVAAGRAARNFLPGGDSQYADAEASVRSQAASRALQVAALPFDAVLEPIATSFRLRAAASHAGLLFRRPPVS